MSLKLSLVIACYNMARELPRTIRSLSPAMQRGLDKSNYEIIVVDNGSTDPFDENACREWGADLRIFRLHLGSASPVQALNRGIQEARAELIGVLIDGARLASPGLLALASMADRLADRTVILTLGFHLGPQMQMKTVLQGYNQSVEDHLLAQSKWTEDGYRLFDISVFAGSSQGGWFRPINESNAIFMRRTLWTELGGFDERFQTPGGGLVNLDTLSRATQLPNVLVVTLLGEGTFHQVHGGAATNAVDSPWKRFSAEYQAIRGHAFQAPTYRSLYFGAVTGNMLASVEASARTGAGPVS